MRRLAIPGIAIVAAAALLALLGFGVAHQGTSTSIDASVARGDFPLAPDAHAQLPILGSSRTESLAQMRGKVVVLNVFASWCPPCLAEAPMLEQEEQALAGHDATILGITYDDTTGDSESFVREHHITYPVFRDVSGNFSRAYGVDGIPETFVINRQGRIVALSRSQLSNTWLAQTLPKVLAEQS
jgi:cytochrome c biogenesis protein CcmG/thiol:disulfide interchange protein DsbE